MTIKEFFVFMDRRPNIAMEFEHFLKQDYKRENISPPPSVLNGWKKNAPQFKHMLIYLLLHKGHYVGSFRVQPITVNTNDSAESEINKISVVYIVPHYRKHGLAYKMLKTITHTRCVLSVKRDNKKAYHLYKKLGFKKYHEDNDVIEMATL